MPKPKPIQLTIPNPCTQSWDEMMPERQGRHCAHCQNVVTDFTGWNDTALYEFISKNKDVKVCGRFRAEQLNRNIVPVQPRSRLYRTFIGVGLTLLFTQVPNTYMHARPPLLVQEYSANPSDINDEVPPVGNDTIIVTGTVKNAENAPMANVGVCVYGDGYKWISKTNENGAFEIRFPNLDNIDKLLLCIGKEGYNRRVIHLNKDEVKIPFRIILQVKSNELIMGGIGG
jgi:hypothetical protein